MAKFEKVKDFTTVDFAMPARKTENAAGYDMVVAEDTIVPSLPISFNYWFKDGEKLDDIYTLPEVKGLMKKMEIFKPILVPSGVKCKLAPNQYLELTVRSSTPLNYGLIMANGKGVIDADYYGNEQNDGHIFFQLYNLSPVDIVLKKGDVICQGIIHTYDTTSDDNQMEKEVRAGGFGSTNSMGDLMAAIFDAALTGAKG